MEFIYNTDICFLVKIHSEGNCFQFQPHLGKTYFNPFNMDGFLDCIRVECIGYPYVNREADVLSNGEFYLIFLSEGC